MRISELAGSAGVPTSTVRYYERVGLLAVPDRTLSGYRDYDHDAAHGCCSSAVPADGPQLRADHRR